MRKKPTQLQPLTKDERKPTLNNRQVCQATAVVTIRNVGRPTSYTHELAAHITERLANGRSLAQVLSEPGMPSKQTVYSWLHTNREFLDHYVRAREEQADYFADECIEIADGAVGMDSAGVAAARVRIEARKWRASVMKPKVYGTKVAAEQNVRVSPPIEQESPEMIEARWEKLNEKLKGFTASTD